MTKFTQLYGHYILDLVQKSFPTGRAWRHSLRPSFENLMECFDTLSWVSVCPEPMLMCRRREESSLILSCADNWCPRTVAFCPCSWEPSFLYIKCPYTLGSFWLDYRSFLVSLGVWLGQCFRVLLARRQCPAIHALCSRGSYGISLPGYAETLLGTLVGIMQNLYRGTLISAWYRVLQSMQIVLSPFLRSLQCCNDVLQVPE